MAHIEKYRLHYSSIPALFTPLAIDCWPIRSRGQNSQVALSAVSEGGDELIFSTTVVDSTQCTAELLLPPIGQDTWCVFTQDLGQDWTPNP